MYVYILKASYTNSLRPHTLIAQGLTQVYQRNYHKSLDYLSFQ